MKRRKITVGDWLRGAGQSIRSGNGMHPIKTQQFINAVHDERVARQHQQTYAVAQKGNWYSKYRQVDGTIHVMLDKAGNLTTSYPHVHVIHDEPGGEIRVVASAGPGSHPAQEILPGSASGNEVNAAIARMIQKL